MIQSMQCLGITDLFSFSKPPSAVKFLVPGVSDRACLVTRRARLCFRSAQSIPQREVDSIDCVE